MALPPLATVADLEAWIGESILDDATTRAEGVLGAASTLVRSHTGRSWVDAEGALEVFDEHHDDIWDALQTVTVQCAGRVWRNPDGSLQPTTGPHSDRYLELLGEGLVLTPTEKSLLGTALGYATGGTQAGLWALSTTRGLLETASCSDDIWSKVPWPE